LCSILTFRRGTVKHGCLPNKAEGLDAGGLDGLAGYEEGGFPSVVFLLHHQDHVKELVEDPPQGLDNTHISSHEKHPSGVGLEKKKHIRQVTK